jgi:hypothetical protein
MAALGGGRVSSSSLPPPPAVTPDAFAQTIGPAPTPATLGTLPAAKTARKPAVWIGGALVLVCSAAGALLVMNHSSTPPADRVASGPAPVNTAVPLVEPGQTRPPTPPPAEVVNAVKPPVMVTLHITGAPAHATATLADHTVDLPGDLVVPSSSAAAKLVIDAPAFKQKVIELHADKNQDVKVPAMERVRRAPPPDTVQQPDRMDIAHPSFPKGGH